MTSSSNIFYCIFWMFSDSFLVLIQLLLKVIQVLSLLHQSSQHLQCPSLIIKCPLLFLQRNRLNMSLMEEGSVWTISLHHRSDTFISTMSFLKVAVRKAYGIQSFALRNDILTVTYCSFKNWDWKRHVTLDSILCRLRPLRLSLVGYGQRGIYHFLCGNEAANKGACC